MAVTVDESELPEELEAPQAVEIAYAETLAEVTARLVRGLPVLLECDKELSAYAYANIRGRLRPFNQQCLYLDGRPRGEEASQGQPLGGIVATMLNQLRDAVRGVVERRVVVLPHLDLLTTSQGGLTSEAREVIPLLYENPELVWLGFKDPSFPLPKVIENLFPHRDELLGIPRDRLRHLVTRREARKFGKPFNPWALYKYVSGLNAVRLRKLLSTVEGEDYPSDPKPVYRQLRQATLTGTLELPEVDLTKDIGGYAKVKERLQVEILDVLKKKDEVTDASEVRRLEELIPRGMIFWGPPGTGKTLFAKAMASALGAAITVVSGPELKSKWVGESEENLRLIFRNARQSAPAIIVFDELDSFATARGTYTGSGVEHSMVNQLLTEMDGFHREEMVFIIGTTNFAESLDPALLRPGRFEFQLHIPYPEEEDRREILGIYDRLMGLKMNQEALDHAVRRTGGYVDGAGPGARHSGDHLNALCRALARIRLRDALDGPTTSELVERALTEWIELPNLTPEEEQTVATHEAGHAVCSMHCEHSAPIERISIRGDAAGALGFVMHADPAHRYVITRARLEDDLCVLMGGRVAEELLMQDVSIGAAEDLRRATGIARALVEEFGLGGQEIGPVRYLSDDPRNHDRRRISEAQLETLDRNVQEILRQAHRRCTEMLQDHIDEVRALRNLLLERKVLDAKTLNAMADEATKPTKSHDDSELGPANGQPDKSTAGTA